MPIAGMEDDLDPDDEPPLGSDGDLVAQMVSDAIIPMLIKSFENGAYDPYSAAQSRKAVDLVEVVQDLMGANSRKFAVSPASLSVSPGTY